MKILIADDHHVVRNGLKHVFMDEFMDVRLGEAENAAEVFKKLREEDWDMIVLDINMPGRNGLEVLQQMRDEKSKIPVLVMSMHAEEQIALRVLKLGAYGYLSKEVSESEIVRAVHLVLSGRRYITPAVAEMLAEQIDRPENRPQHEYLSEREYQTMLAMGKGMTISKIAEMLSVSVNTISTYRARILEKMKMKSNAEIIAYVIGNKLTQ
jgi:DNA-binding NarL/FixJ family response regulator